MNLVDKFLNNFTMYRIVLYGLIILTLYAFILSFLQILSYTPLELFLSLLTLTFVCYFGNLLLARLFKATTNAESSLITALILFFLLWPSVEISSILIIAAAGAFAMISKYVLSYRKKHIFNPAAIGAVAILIFNSGGVWWVGTLAMLPVTLIVGLLIVRKIRKFTLFFTFLGVTVVSFVFQVMMRNLNPLDEVLQFFISFPVIFFGTVMLTEPLTLPPTRKLQAIYGALVGFLFSYQGTLGPVPIILTTELILLFGNIFSFFVSPKYRLYLRLKEKKQLALDTIEYIFDKPKYFSFFPGQYMEWTIPMRITDSRGNRRYFTIASSPTEETVRLGIKHNNPSSMFKKKLSEMKIGDTISASQLVGDFTVNNNSKKLVFIAGGIGVTPFRSIIKNLIDNGQKKDIVFFYTNKTTEEIAYKELFDNSVKIGVKTVYILSDESKLPFGWSGEKGRINESILKKHVPDYKDRTFYLSGPNAMVESYKRLLRSLGVNPTKIVTDYFPGF